MSVLWPKKRFVALGISKKKHWNDDYQRTIYRYGLELEKDWERKHGDPKGAAMKTIFEDDEAKLTVGKEQP